MVASPEGEGVSRAYCVSTGGGFAVDGYKALVSPASEVLLGRCVPFERMFRCASAVVFATAATGRLGAGRCRLDGVYRDML